MNNEKTNETYGDQIKRASDEFAARVADICKRAASHMLDVAPGGGAPGAVVVVVDAAPTTPAKRASKRAAKPAKEKKSRTVKPETDRKKGDKRSPEELTQIKQKLLDYIKAHPEGPKAEEINKALGTTTPEIMLPMRHLLKAKSVRKKGAKRGTQYFAAT